MCLLRARAFLIEEKKNHFLAGRQRYEMRVVCYYTLVLERWCDSINFICFFFFLFSSRFSSFPIKPYNSRHVSCIHVRFILSHVI